MKFGETEPAVQPILRLATAALRPSDRPVARSLGEALFDRFNRDREHPLAYGLGIPVAIDVPKDWLDRVISSDRAVQTLMIVVAGSDSVLLSSAESIKTLNELGSPEGSEAQARLRPMLVTTDDRWLQEAKRLPKIAVCEAVHAKASGDDNGAVLDCIVLEVAKLLRQVEQGATKPEDMVDRPRLLLPGGFDRNGDRRLEAYFACISEVTEQAFGDAIGQTPPLSAILVSVGGASSSRGAQSNRGGIVEQQRSLAEQHGWPTVTVDPGEAQAATAYQDILRRAAIEHLRQHHFLLQAQRIIQNSGMPFNTAVIPRQPQLIDVTCGRLRERSTGLVIHPDPMLTPRKRQVLRSARPRLRCVTPSTLLGRGQRKLADQSLQTPLDGVDVGLSISLIGDSDFSAGQTFLHLQDAAVQVVRTLLSGGARISYGGSFAVGGPQSFNPILAKLVESYHETASHSTDLLNIYLAAHESLSSIPPDIRCHVRHVGLSDDLAAEAIFEKSIRKELPDGMLYSEMRKVMNAEVVARVAIGGKKHPKRNSDDRQGYSGRFPGVAEEVYRALEAGQPLYIGGGFGGVSKELVELLRNPDQVGDYWRDSSDDDNADFTRLRVQVDRHPQNNRLGLPGGREAMANKIAEHAMRLGNDDAAWIESNGLTRHQNEMLWHSTDPVLISSLVAEGLVRWRRETADASRRRIEIMHGDIISLPAVDLIAVPVFDDVEPQGAGAAIDRATEGLVRRAAATPGRLVGISQTSIDADYLTTLSLGRLSELTDGHHSSEQGVGSDSIDNHQIKKVIREASRQLGQLCVTEGLGSVGLVTFAGSTQLSYEKAMEAMLEGLGQADESLIIRWAEYDGARFEKLRSHLESRSDVRVTTVVRPSQPQFIQRYPWYSLSVHWNEVSERLSVTGLGRDSTAATYSRTTSLTEEGLESFSVGIGQNNRVTPNQAELIRRGRELAELLFGDDAPSFWKHYRDVPLAIVHDEACSKLPFELLQFGDSHTETTPSIRAGIHRWLAAANGSLEGSLTQMSPSPMLRVGLIIDPDETLPGAQAEGRKIRSVLSGMAGKVRLTCLGDDAPLATCDEVMELMTRIDVLHYCGHAGFNPDRRERSALKLYDGKLTGQDLARLRLVPRIVILNACEAGRVRSDERKRASAPMAEAHSLAQTIISAGVEAFVGTLWEVGDESAKQFAGKLYQGLTAHESLRDSVTAARQHLATTNQKDWGNYLLYGDGRFQLP